MTLSVLSLILVSKKTDIKSSNYARVAELVDALDLGSSSGDRVGVQVSPLAPSSSLIFNSLPLLTAFENVISLRINIRYQSAYQHTEFDVGRSFFWVFAFMFFFPET